MGKYRATVEMFVDEICLVDVIVEADNIEEALKKANSWDWENEEDSYDSVTLSREISQVNVINPTIIEE